MRSLAASRAPSTRLGSTDRQSRRRISRAAEPDNSDGKLPSSPQPPQPPPQFPPPISSPTDLVTWGGRLPSRRRLLVSGAASTSIILAGNFGGATSFLLSSSDAATTLARSLKLDVLFPIRGFKRALAPDGGGYEFIYPRDWLFDQTIARKRAVASDLSRPILEGPFPSEAAMEARRRRARAAPAAPPGPEVAFGPAGSRGETNVSVIVAPIEPGFSMRQLGTPEEAGKEFLATTIAKPGSGREAELLRAEERSGGDEGDEGDEGVLYYEFEYRVRGAQFDRLNCSAFAGREGSPGGSVGPELVTLNAQAPWEETQRDPALAAALRASARSLKVGKRSPGVSFGAGARPF